MPHLTRGLATLATVFIMAAATLAAFPACAQYPAKPVRMLVGFPPGGGVDITARIIAQKLSERWGKPVVVDNRTGAAGNIATDMLAKSAPDGYTLIMAFSSHSSNAALYDKLPFDINRDFTAITLVATAPVVVTASQLLPVRTLAELIAYAQARPGLVKYASSGVGTPVHLSGEFLAQLAGLRMTHVPYKGISPAMTAMLGGETDITFPAVLSGLQHFKSGKLKALAVASKTRYPELPDVPTTAEAGLPGYEVEYWYTVMGPAGMPRTIVEQIQRDVAAVVNTPEMQQSLLAQGSVAVGSSPEQAAARIRSEYALWNRVVKTGNIKPE
jgi:tripartite-type tricarboxylate transporter receptor subunit TctC